jgi:serine/threonine-protein kinase
MQPELAARLIADAAEGLHAAHELRGKNGEPLNLVHRDVTPHNLFLTYEGMVKVVDFGIAKVSGRLSSTRAGTLKGKLAYMSPEQVRGAAIDRRTDIFALGVVLWELTTGHRLFRMESDLDTLEKVQSCIVPPPSSLRPDYPAELESIVMHALQKRPESRYQTARELSRALQRYLMSCGSFIGPEEVSAYVTQLFGDRIRKREEHLRWAAEVTQTISLEMLKSSAKGPGQGEEISLNSLEEPSGLIEEAEEERGAVTARPPAKAREEDELAKTSAMPKSQVMRAAPIALPPAHGIHKPAPRVPEAIARPGPSVVISATPPSAPGYPMPPEEDEEEIATIVAPSSRLGADHVPDGPLPAAGAPAMRPRTAPIPAAGGYGPQGYPSASMPTAPPGALQFGAYGQPQQQPAYAQQQGYAQGVQQPYYPPGVTQGVQQMAAPPPNGFRAFRPTDETQQLKAVDKNKNLTVVYVAAAIGTFFVVVGVAGVLFLRMRLSQRQNQVPAVTALAAVPSATAEAKPAPTMSAPVEPVATVAAPPVPSVTAAATAQAQPTATDTAPASKPDKADSTSKAASNDKKAATGGAAAPATTGKDTAPSGGEPGFLTVVCTPFCDSVSAGGRNLGPSPVMRAPLPPGQYRVVLKRNGGPPKVIPAIIVSGQSTSQRVPMN